MSLLAHPADPAADPAAEPAAGWRARLALDFRREGGRTVMRRAHSGPLLVQKALYPEGGALCHALLIHPPGGIAGGDALEIDLHAGAGAHALVTTPGATRWYKANGRAAAQTVRMSVDGALEWLPQEGIVFDAAEVRSALEIDVADGAATIGWDFVALGRAASGERFASGRFAQTIRLRDAGVVQWIERTHLSGDDELLQATAGLGGRRVFGCLWAVGPRWRSAQVEALRETLARQVPEAPLTQLAPRLLVARVLAGGTEAARRALAAVWHALRPEVFAGRAAVMPRIWAT